MLIQRLDESDAYQEQKTLVLKYGAGTVISIVLAIIMFIEHMIRRKII